MVTHLESQKHKYIPGRQIATDFSPFRFVMLLEWQVANMQESSLMTPK